MPGKQTSGIILVWQVIMYIKQLDLKAQCCIYISIKTILKHLQNYQQLLPSINATPNQKNCALYSRIKTKHSVHLLNLHHPHNAILQ